MKLLFALLLCFTVFLVVVNAASARPILLEDVQALTFYRDQKTNARRSTAIPQLRCVGSECNPKIAPSVVQCRNSGSAGNGNVQWECKAELPNGVKLGRVNVNCEGFSGPNDRYVLEGSCGLEYSLIGAPAGSWEHSARPHHAYRREIPTSKSAGSTLLFLFLLGLGAYFFFFRRSTHHQTAAQPRRGGFGPGLGGLGGLFGAGNANANPNANANVNTGFFGGGNADRPKNENRGGPGFWTGMLGGAGAGYLFGRRAGRGQAAREREATYDTYARASSPIRDTRETYETRTDSGTHESTGFGGTTRR